MVTPNGFPVLSKPSKALGPANGAAGGGGLFGLIGAEASKSGQANVPVRDPAPEERVIRLGNGAVEITNDGIIRQGGAEIAQFNVEEFHENQWLEKSGNGFYRNVEATNLKNTGAETRTHQGYLEGSNVNPVAEMTRMIEATRAYESHLQAIKTYQDIDARTVNDIAKER